MLKKLLVLFCCFCFINSYSQNYWYKEIPNNNKESPVGDIIELNNSYYFNLIESFGASSSNYYAQTCKVSKNGNIYTTGILDLDRINMLGAMLSTSDNHILSYGHVCNSIDDLDFDLWFVEFNEDLEIIEEWEVDTPDLGFGYIMNIMKMKDQNVLFQINTSSIPFTGLPGNGYIAMIDTNNTMIKDSLFDHWLYDIGLVFHSDTLFMVNSKELDSSNNLKGNQINIMDYDFNLIATPVSYTGDDMNYYFSIHNSEDSSYYFSAMCSSLATNTVINHAARKVSKSFNELNHQVFDSAAYWYYTCDHNGIDSYDQFMYTGGNFEYRGMSQNYPNTFSLSQMDTSLNILNQRFYGGDKNYLLNSIKTTSEGDVLLLGRCSELDSDLWNIFIMKVNQEGLITSTNNNAEIPIKNAIVLPNPGREYLELHTGVYPATLQLHNLNGSLAIEEAINSNISRINTLELSSGTYIWSLVKEGKVVESGKWIRE